jgi:heterodisulfide reductase subunit A
MPDITETQNHQNAQNSQQDGQIRIGVYTCYCGGNISDVVDVETIAKALLDLPNVVVSRTNMSMCSDAGQAIVEQDIKELGVNRVVIGACAPSLHRETFRGTVARAGLNPYYYYHVGIREQDSWVHKDDPTGATAKALRLMTAGVAKARLLQPLEPIRLQAQRHALVIGGGVAGLRCAWDIARQGLHVSLVEKSPFLGGRVAQLETTFPIGEPARDGLHELIERVLTHPRITVFTQADIVGVNGYVGDFRVELSQHSRGVSDDIADKAMAACQVEVPDDYNYALTKRKLIYRAYSGCYPPTAAVDWANCPDSHLELEIYGERVVLEDEPKAVELSVGAIVVATGFNPYEPRRNEFGYGVVPEVLTMPQLIRLLALTPEGKDLEWNGHSVRDVTMIHCVGSRQIEGVNEPQADGQVNNYCSRVCCTAALQLANDLRERFPDMNIFDLYQDIRTYGRGHEDIYVQASRNMVRFLRYHGEEPPEVVLAPKGDTHSVLVKVKDSLAQGEELEIPTDLVVLAVGIMPRPVDDLIKMLNISPGTDRFLLEVHPKLRPVETAIQGVVLAGTAQGPMNIQEACAAASAAAVKVVGLLGKGAVELEPFVAAVNPERCTGTGSCVTVCPYEDAISVQTVPESGNGHLTRRAVVTAANCTGCGACVSACPNRAIDVQGWELSHYEAMLDAIMGDLPELEVVTA